MRAHAHGWDMHIEGHTHGGDMQKEGHIHGGNETTRQRNIAAKEARYIWRDIHTELHIDRTDIRTESIYTRRGLPYGGEMHTEKG